MASAVSRSAILACTLAIFAYMLGLASKFWGAAMITEQEMAKTKSRETT
jgi:cytochrome c biogenesis protein CcdA